MSHGTAQVDQSALGQDDDVTAALQTIAIDLKEEREEDYCFCDSSDTELRASTEWEHRRENQENRCQTLNIKWKSELGFSM